MKVTFQIENAAPVVIEGNPGDNLLALARMANVAIDAPLLRQRLLRQVPRQAH